MRRIGWLQQLGFESSGGKTARKGPKIDPALAGLPPFAMQTLQDASERGRADDVVFRSMDTTSIQTLSGLRRDAVLAECVTMVLV